MDRDAVKMLSALTLGEMGSRYIYWGYLPGVFYVYWALRALGNHFKDREMKRDALWWVIWVHVVGPMIIISFILLWDYLPRILDIMTFMVALLSGEIPLVLSARHLKRAYAKLAAEFGVGTFNTATKLYWWGSLLFIALVGIPLLWICWYFSAKAFSSTLQLLANAAESTPST